MLIEKAWAKVHGGYLNINAGLIREALHDLTGAPAITFFNDEKTREERWNIIWDADQNNFIMCAGTEDLMGDGTDQQEQRTGIVGSHAYAMIAAVSLVRGSRGWEILRGNDGAKGRTVERLLQLRNPWGKGESKLAWCDGDSKWNEVSTEVKKEMKYVDKDDGTFWMRFEDFEKYYSDFQVCYYYDNYTLCSYPYDTKKNEVLEFQFTITKAAEWYFSLNQVNKRFYPKDKGYKYSNCSLIVMTKNKYGKWELVGSCSKPDKEYWFKAMSQPGTYYAIVHTPWESFADRICFTTYGPEETQVQKLRTGAIKPEWIAEAIGTDACSKSADWKPYTQQGEPECSYKFEHGSTGIGYFCFNNKGTST
jgi:hypothetical protein